ncbi:hypothetical protein [Compostimonas suwonensis]|uniref:Type IV secretion protein Rhs n=1 Tax=Compostimonas suwonensis TaxID=1048394 RepID=A0A2M9C4S8_9MICO|nr:hypothetical protein [Compostimonas suwonensis]PJJ65512.1 hypothetical protein CLV54_0545 [Compostimonas suwonensis]
MARGKSDTAGDTPAGAKGFGGLVERMNRKLFPYLGPPPLGPYDEAPPQPSSERACPLCGQPMSLHEIDRSGERTQLYCPTAAA